MIYGMGVCEAAGVLDGPDVAVSREVDVGTAVRVGVRVIVAVGDGMPVGVMIVSAI